MHLNWFLSILSITEERGKALSDDEAQHLSDKLPLTTHPHRYIDAKKIVQSYLDELNKYK